MTKAADNAFQLAKERIAQAKREGWVKLELKAPEFSDLELLPEEISGFAALTTVSLFGTRVSDVSSLSSLTSLGLA